MMRLSISTLLVLSSVAIIAFAFGWLMGDETRNQPAMEKTNVLDTSRDSPDDVPDPSFQNHIDIKALETQQLSLAGEPPIVQRFSIDQDDTRTLSRSGEDMIIGLVEVEADYVEVNINNQTYKLQSGNYVDTLLGGLTCRLLLLKYQWSSSSRSAEFSCECSAEKIE